MKYSLLHPVLKLYLIVQFIVYGGYFLAIAAVYLVLPLARLIKKLHNILKRLCVSKDEEMDVLSDSLSAENDMIPYAV